MTYGFKNADWRMLLQKFGEWEHSKYDGPNAMSKAYVRPSYNKIRDYYFYCRELSNCKIVGYPGQQMYSVAGLVIKEGRKFFRTYIGSSRGGVRMLEAPYDLLWNNK